MSASYGFHWCYHCLDMLGEPLLDWIEKTSPWTGEVDPPRPSDLLRPGAPDDCEEILANAVEHLTTADRLAIDIVTAAKAVDRLRAFGVGWSEIDDYCRARFPGALLARYHVISALILLSGCHIGVHVGRNVVKGKLPSLVLDDDSLLLEVAPQVEFRKEGVLATGYLLQYSDYLLSYNLALQGGFLEALVDCGRTPGTRIRAAINPHIILDRDYWSPIYHRVYIRGPKAPSQDRLADPRFPRVATGEVTEHKRLGMILSWS